MGRCMSALKGEFPDMQQRMAVCMKQSRGGGRAKTQRAYDDIALLVDQLEAAGEL